MQELLVNRHGPAPPGPGRRPMTPGTPPLTGGPCGPGARSSDCGSRAPWVRRDSLRVSPGPGADGPPTIAITVTDYITAQKRLGLGANP